MSSSTTASFRRDIVCIGVADGRVLPLAELLAQLPADFPAAVFILSMRCKAGALLPSLLGRSSALPVAEATDDEPIACRRIRVAPCVRQLRLTSTTTELAAPFTDSRMRPTVDALFRSAAASLGRRVIGILLGAQEYDASAGARAIHGCGGLILEAGVGGAAPTSSDCHPDFVVPIEHMGELLMRLTAIPASMSGSFPLLERDAIERTNLVVAADRIPVTALLVEAVAAAESAARRRSVQLRCVWERDVTVVLADRRRLRRILTGLLTHTIESTPRDGTVLLSAEVGVGEIRFCVADTGPQSTLEEREHLLDDDASCSFAGAVCEADPTSVVREFVEAHGGHIWIDSDPVTGSAFYFTLPSLPCVMERADESRA